MKKGVLFILLISFISFLSQCGGALPQTSIPLPSNDPVTVSSPDASGNVTIAAAASSVPNSSIVVVQVSASSSMNMQDLFEGYFSVAHAEVCTSTLSSCPSLDGDGKCQSTANSDGSFSIQVPATSTDSISVTYFDPDDSCTEKTLLTGEAIPDNVIPLDRDVVDAHLTADGLVYALGADSSDEAYVSVISLEDLAVSFEYDLSSTSIDGTSLERLTFATDSNLTHDYLVIEDETHLPLFPVSGSSLGTAVQFFESGGSSASSLSFIHFNTVEVTTETFSDFSCVTSYATGLSYDRVLLYSKEDNRLAVVDEFTESSNETVRYVTIDLSQFTDIDSIDTIYHAQLVPQTDDEMILIANVTNTSAQTESYIFTFEIGTGFCPSNSIQPVSGASLGITMSDPQLAGFTTSFTGEEQQWYSVFDSSSQQFSLVNYTELSSGTDPDPYSLSTYFGDTSDSYFGMGAMTVAASDTADQTFHLVFSGNRNANYKALTYSQGTVAENTSISTTLVNSISPLEMILGSSLSSTFGSEPAVVVDSGVADDGQSNIIFLENILAE